MNKTEREIEYWKERARLAEDLVQEPFEDYFKNRARLSESLLMRLLEQEESADYAEKDAGSTALLHIQTLLRDCLFVKVDPYGDTVGAVRSLIEEVRRLNQPTDAAVDEIVEALRGLRRSHDDALSDVLAMLQNSHTALSAVELLLHERGYQHAVERNGARAVVRQILDDLKEVRDRARSVNPAMQVQLPLGALPENSVCVAPDGQILETVGKSNGISVHCRRWSREHPVISYEATTPVRPIGKVYYNDGRHRLDVGPLVLDAKPEKDPTP